MSAPTLLDYLTPRERAEVTALVEVQRKGREASKARHKIIARAYKRRLEDTRRPPAAQNLHARKRAEREARA